MARLGLETEIVDRAVYERAVGHFRAAGIVLPTFGELAAPSTQSSSVTERLESLDPDAAEPGNLFRVNWYNDAQRSGRVDVPDYVEIPSELTGVDARIILALGNRFPMIRAHKVLAAYGCLAPRIITGQFDPTVHRAVWPSTGNYCRGGVAISRIMGCHGVAVLPEGMSKERFDWLDQWVAHFAADAQDGPDETELSDGTGVTGIGQRVITWGSAGMPAVSVRFQPDLPETIDIAVTGTDCVRITNYAAVIDETPDRRRSGRLIDFMVQPPFQFEIPDRFGSRPARTDLIRTEEWKAFGVTVDAAVIDPFLIGSRWPTWQLTWNQVVTAWRENPDPIETEVEIKP